MTIDPIREFAGDVVRAFEMAAAEIEPLFVPISVHADDRGWSIMNQLQGILRPEGQINYSVLYAGAVKAWHRHQKQTDFWICVAGHLKVGIHRDDNRTWQAVFGEMHPGLIIIPPPLWHGCAAVGGNPASLLYYLTHRYDPASPDEDRRAFDSVDGFPWGVQHR
jgi:dTDP-4-dehydrorhamnose 3,5-epimerase